MGGVEAEEGRKKVMIAARERGPGPGRYGLPSTVGSDGHDYTKHKKPAYSFGGRLDNSMFSKDISPGPKYAIDARYTRVGAEGEPKYSMLARQPELRPFKTPGPGTYRPEAIQPPHQRYAPKYSLSARTRSRRQDNNPSPSTYKLPSVLGPTVPNRRSAPSYSIRPRTKGGQGFDEDLAKTPGPAKYKTTAPCLYKRRAPNYSLGARCAMPGDGTKKPGPGAHSPERVYARMHRGRSFSMGIRHSEYITPLIVDVFD